ncbi:MAG: SUMF1/EgtB/PvdO family nonheme iron enzyme [Minwuia sp.]|nr:SUMF1/EgtB/PvdO family nonheme iron enzyme [Minwuia sp.]
MNKIIALLVVVFGCVGFVTASQAERRVALVIGNANYNKAPDLRNPVNDARSMGKRLKELGFELSGGSHYENVTRVEMARLVRRFSSEVGRDDTAFIFYAGHGIGAHGTNWMVPTDDDDIQTALDLPDFAISVSSLMERLERRGGGTNIVMLDACRDNPLPSDTRSSGSTRGLGRMAAPNGTFIAYAADPGQVAYDGEGNNGLFTESLMKALREPDRPLYEIMRAVRREVRRKTSGAQTPWTEESLNNEFFFVEPQDESQVRVAALQPQTQPVAPPPGAAPATSGWISAAPAPAPAPVVSAPSVPALESTPPQQQEQVVAMVSPTRTATQSATSVAPEPVIVARPEPVQQEVRVAAATVVPNIPSSPSVTLDSALITVTVGDMIPISPSPFQVMQANGGAGTTVHIAHRFAIGKYEITFDMWDACVDEGGCMGYRPADDGEGRGERPVMNVEWKHVAAFLDWANRKTGLAGRPDALRLPTEAEWEYAARAGTSSTFSYGDDQDDICKFANVMDYYGGRHFPIFPAVDCDDDYVRPAPVGSYKPNGFGLHDMIGNVSEWTADCWSRKYGKIASDGSAFVSDRCTYHVTRGGSWMVTPKNMGERARGYKGTENLGFRVARTLQ